MSVFIAAGDESKPKTEEEATHCVYGGYLASEENWRLFVQEWLRDVVESDPEIEYFHMTDLRDPRRYPDGLSAEQARGKVIAAYRALGQAKYLRPVMVSFNNSAFSKTLKEAVFTRPQRSAARIRPEHLGFFRFVKAAADCADKLEPGARHVDIMFENSVAKGDPESRNSSVVRDFEDIFDCARRALHDSGERAMAARLRDCYPASKKRPQVQAADCAAWICRHLYNKKRLDIGTIDPLDVEHAAQLTHLGRDLWLPEEKDVVGFANQLISAAEAIALERRARR